MPICGKRESLPSLKNLWSFFETSHLRAPNSLAIVDAKTNEKLTYSQLSSRVNKLSRFFLRLLTNEHQIDTNEFLQPIAVCIPPSIDLVICLFAILQIKRAYLPLDVDLPTSRVNHILQDAKPQLVVFKDHQPALADILTNSIENLLFIDLQLLNNEIQSERGSSLDQELISPSDGLLAVLYTSGSTGTPKGVRIPHSAVLNRLLWQWKTFPYAQNEVCCFKTALSFVDSMSEIYGPLLTSHQLVVIPKRIIQQTELLLEVLEDFRIGRLVLVPSLLRSILLSASRNKNPLPRLKLWICSGETLQPNLLYSFFETFKNNQTICNFYGSTEVMGDVTFIYFKTSEDIIKSLFNNKVPIGYPLFNVDIYLVNTAMEEVQDGEVGELLVAGFNLADGYVGQAQTNKFIKNIWSSETGYSTLYRTGDFGRFVNSNLIFEGRVDSQVKIRGHRIDLTEIEMTLQRIQEIDKCCVISFHPGEIDQNIVAFFTTNQEDVSVDQIKSKMVPLLSIYMQPKLLKIDEMPFLVNGKIDRQKLIKLFETKGSKDTEQDIHIDLSNCINGKEEEANVLIQTLIRILGPSASPSIDLNQNFFDIGGNSLNAILAITSYQDAGYYVEISEFLNASSLNDIVKHASKIEHKSFDQTNQKEILHEEEKYISRPIRDGDKEAVKRLLCKCFITKGDLEVALKVTENEYLNVIDQIFDLIMNRKLSFAVSRKGEEEIIAVSINADYSEEPSICYPSKNVQYIFDFLEECETKVRFLLPEGGKVCHSFMMATNENISPSENVVLIRFMEEENVRIAKEQNCDLIFTTNTSDITQHVCEDLMSYKILGTFQINNWEAQNGSKPFQHAKDDQFVVCSALFL